MATKQQIAELYVATFNRAADASGLAYWDGSASVSSTLTNIEDIAKAMLASTEASAIYAGLSREDTVIKMYSNLFNRTVDAADSGVIYWTSGAGASVSSDSMILALVNGALGADKQTIDNKVTVGQAFAAAGNNDVAQAISVMQDVTSNSATVQDALLAIDSSSVTLNHYLTTGQDMAMGGSGSDMFIARGNSSLDNADIIDGKGGIDTIEVMLDNNETAESPLVTNVEVLKVQAQSRTATSGDNDVDSGADVEANIDAGDMSSVEVYWSEDSRSDMTIEDISRNSHITTVAMRETDPGDVDANFYFDPENITAAGTNTSKFGELDIRFADLLELAKVTTTITATPAALSTALTDKTISKLTTLSIDVGGTTYNVPVTGATSYDDLGKKIIDYVNGVNNNTDLSYTLAKTDDLIFSTEIRNADGTTKYAQGATAGTIPVITISSATQNVDEGTFAYNSTSLDDNIFASQDFANTTSTVNSLTQVDVIVDRVGKDSQGGDLQIGSDSTGASGSKGIQQFNVWVDRDSNLGTLNSTNNTLEVVNVKQLDATTATAKYTTVNNANGNGNISIDVLNDVRVFDASTMTGSANVTATLTENVSAKYLDAVDQNPYASTDNSEQAWNNVTDTFFSYDFGSNNDTLNLTIASDNMDIAGATTREDFVLEIKGNAGNDSITTNIDDEALAASNWYLNSKDVANLTVDGGAGNDTITTTGAGDFIINAGAGTDTVYTDNSGTMSEWAFNAAIPSTDNDLDGNTLANNFLYKATVTVTYSGDTTTGGVTSAAAAARNNGFESQTITIETTNGVGNQSNVNQAIKKAINSDAVLSKLLVAKDGPDNTLVVDSLVDGAHAANDLEVTFANYTVPATTSAEYSTILGYWQAFSVNSALATVTTADLTGQVTAFTTANPTYTTANQTLAGTSAAVGLSDNTVNLGTSDASNDVLVLGTGLTSNDTVVVSGTGFGTDTIVNFTTGGSQGDALSFAEYLTSQTDASANTNNVSATTIATTYNAAEGAVVGANTVTIVDSFASATNQSWANLNAANFLSAVSTAASSYGSLDDADFGGTTVTNLVGTTYKSIFMVENDLNDGHYKVFDTTVTNTGDISSAVLLGELDFGESLGTVVSSANFSASGSASFGSATGGGTTPGTGGGTTPTTAAITVANADALTALDTLTETYTVPTTATLAASIADFDAANDKLSITGATAGAISVTTGVLTDGNVSLSYTPDAGTTVIDITLTGLTLAEEAGIGADVSTILA